MAVIRSGDLDRQIRFERPVGDAAPDDAGSVEWEAIDPEGVMEDAQVQDMLPSHGERLADGLNIAFRPARIRIRYRDDITAAMRVIYGKRVMEIVGEPVELGRGEGLEFMAQDFSVKGGASILSGAG